MSDKTVYIVTEGEYSAYGIVAVFDDRTLADAYVTGDKDRYEMRVEKWVLNPGADRIREGLKTYTVWLLRDGTVHQVTSDWSEAVQPGRVASYADYQGDRIRRRQCFEVTLYAKTEEQAIKAANERRAQYLAEGGAWPTGEVQ